MEDVIDFNSELRRLAELSELELPSDEEFERLVATLYKKVRKRRRRSQGQQRKLEDREARKAAAGIRAESRDEAVPFAFDREGRSLELQGKSSSCYVCNEPYRTLHPFYHMLCPSCGDRCYSMREVSADLTGRTALLTGGRIKTGFESALKLLRAGCQVHVTTRYPRDAVQRYSELEDFLDWSERLVVHHLDLLYLPRVLEFVAAMDSQIDSLEILVNHAAQSVKRSEEYHQRLLKFENTAKLTREEKRCLGYDRRNAGVIGTSEAQGAIGENALSQLLPDYPRELIRDDDDRLDQRELNSWNMRLGDVEPRELLEVTLINSTAPAILMRGFLDSMRRSRFTQRQVINVNGADGTFALSKSGYHAHVNMSKAALNMLTRSCHRDFARDRIYVNSVDTGWITHEGSFSFREKRIEEGFVPPFDAIDGAARILNPIFQMINHESEPVHGVLFRNFQSSPW